MEKEKEAYSRWLHKLPDLSDDEKRFLECVRKDHRVDESVVLFYAGYHSRDEEFAALKAEIERKNKAILDALTIDAKDGYSMHPDSVKILMKVMKKR